MRVIDIGQKKGCSQLPIEIDGQKLYVGKMVHVLGTHLDGCMPAHVLEFDEKGTCRVAPAGGSWIPNVPYGKPREDDVCGYSWHFAVED